MKWIYSDSYLFQMITSSNISFLIASSNISFEQTIKFVTWSGFSLLIINRLTLISPAFVQLNFQYSCNWILFKKFAYILGFWFIHMYHSLVLRNCLKRVLIPNTLRLVCLVFLLWFRFVNHALLYFFNMETVKHMFLIFCLLYLSTLF